MIGDDHGPVAGLGMAVKSGGLSLHRTGIC